MLELRSLLCALAFPARALAVIGVAFQASACGSAHSPAPRPDSETHFLRACEDECPGDLACICGVCSVTCDPARDCGDTHERARCVSASEFGEMAQCNADDASPSVCDVACADDADCEDVGPMHTCRDGHCRAPAVASITGCVYDGRSYMHGETFTDSAGCNQCVCQEDGQVACDTRACEDEACAQPFEVGVCDAAIRVFWHNPELGVCEPMVYGGCGGNDNRFESRAECEAACNVRRGTGASCLVEGTTYAHGETVPDPFSCNSCQCEDGQVTVCTEIGCGEVCGDGTIEGSGCAECGPAGGCAVVETGCLRVCRADANCSDPSRPFCDEQGRCVGARACL